jgi:hypothetical protein
MHYRHVGMHPEDTAEGAVLAPGESTESLNSFDASDPHNKRLIDDGVLIKIHEHKDDSKGGKEDK